MGFDLALEITGLVTGLACVWLLVRENVWTFPLGLAYAVVTVVVVASARLYADVLLNLYYVAMNAYGWYFWLRVDRGGRSAVSDTIAVSMAGANLILWLAVITLVGTAALGWFFSTYTNADLAYADSFTTVASFVGMWMSARKQLESWIVWFVIDVVQVVLYVIKGIEAYAVLYAVYLVMAVWGYRQWRASFASAQRLANDA